MHRLYIRSGTLKYRTLIKGFYSMNLVSIDVARYLDSIIESFLKEPDSTMAKKLVKKLRKAYTHIKKGRENAII